MKNYLLLPMLIIFSYCAQIHNNPINSDKVYEGKIVINQSNEVYINNSLIFYISDLKYIGSNLFDNPEIDSYIWDINCDNKNVIETKDSFLSFYFDTFGSYKVCAYIIYFFNQDKRNLYKSLISKNNFNSIINVIPNPRIYIGGSFNSYKLSSYNNILRVDQDGNVDENFNSGLGPGFEESPNIIEAINDKFIIGHVRKFNRETIYGLTSLNNDLSLGSYKLIFQEPYATAKYQDQNKILVAGYRREAINGAYVYSPRLVRLTLEADGSFTEDESFRDNFSSSLQDKFKDGRIYSVIIDNRTPSSFQTGDDPSKWPKIYIGGTFKIYNDGSGDKYLNGIARINNNGTLDTLFNNDFSNINNGFDQDKIIRSIQLYKDKYLIIAGDFTKYNNYEKKYLIMIDQNGSYNSDAFLTNFNTTINNSTNSNILDVRIDANDKILLAGNFTAFNGNNANRLLRLNSTGSFDSTFDIGNGFNSRVNKILLNNNKIILGGNFTSFNNDYTRPYVIRLNSNGTMDNSFIVKNNEEQGINNEVLSVMLDNNNNYIILGRFKNYFKNTSISSNRIGAIDYYNGALDTTFNIGTGFNNVVHSILIDTDNKPIIAGAFTRYKNVDTNRIVKLNFDGSIDTSFNVGTGFNNIVNVITFDNEGRIIAGGIFTKFNGNKINNIARLNKNGTLDTSFNTGSLTQLGVRHIELDINNKILISGWYKDDEQIDKEYLIRVNNNGILDNTFTYDAPIYNQNKLDLMRFYKFVFDEDNIILGGYFDLYNKNRGLVKLDANGNEDTTFNNYFGFNFHSEWAFDMLKDDDKLYVVGSFNSYNNASSSRFAKIDLNTGLIDSGFNIGTGFNDHAFSIHRNFDNKLIIAGIFSKFNGQDNNGIIKIDKETNEVDTSFNCLGFDGGIIYSIKSNK